VAVAEIVRGVTDDEQVIAAAYLHDVVEDTPVTLEHLREVFGERVSNLVYWLTDKSKPQDGNRRTRKAIDRDHIAAAPSEAQTIKLADIIDNTQSILTHDAAFARVYLFEKALLLDVMTKSHQGLMQRARRQLAVAT